MGGIEIRPSWNLYKLDNYYAYFCDVVMAIFNIIHISDLHLGRQDIKNSLVRARNHFLPELSPHQPYLLDALQDRIYLLKNEMESVDLIIISGDIATTGHAGDLQVAFSIISTLNAFNLLVLPGNHDRFRGTLAEGPGGTKFDDHFHSMWPSGKTFHHKVIEKDGEEIAIICADLTFRMTHPENPTGISAMWGQGIVYSDAASGLEEEVRDIRAKKRDIEIILVIHFTPHSPPSCQVAENLKLRKEELFLNVAEDRGIKYLLCGHIHETKSYERNHLSVYVASTPTQEQNENEFSVYHLDVQGNKVQNFQSPVIYKYDGNGAFIYDRFQVKEVS